MCVFGPDSRDSCLDTTHKTMETHFFACEEGKISDNDQFWAQCWNVSTLLPLLESTFPGLLRDRERRDEFAALWALGLKVLVTLAALRTVLFQPAGLSQGLGSRSCSELCL